MDKKYYVGIDLGGTFVKGGVVDGEGNILAKDKVPTEKEKGAERVTENIANLVKKLMSACGLSVESVRGIGIGSPGMIDSHKGEVVFSGNLNWEHFAVAERLQTLTGLPVKIANDANVAALGEAKFGAAKGKQNVVMITLGTGVGGGVVADGKLLEGNCAAGAELGHSVLVAGGEQCTCGRRGCMETYASATALIRDTKRAMEAHKDSKMWEVGSLNAVTGETAFRYKDCDEYAKAVVEKYIQMLACGLTNFANIFRPEIILLGGGVCAEGDNLVKPVQALLDKEIFAGDRGPRVEVRVAELGNSAGLLGAAALLL